MTDTSGYLNLTSETEILAHWANDPTVRSRASQTNSRGVGPAQATLAQCPKCLTRDADQIGRFPIAQHVVHLSKNLVDREIARLRKDALVIPTQLLHYLIYQNEWEEAHVVHVANVTTPGVVAFGALQLNGNPTLFAFLIDGTHRAAAALRAGREFRAYCLVPRDVAACAEATNKLIQRTNVVLVDPADMRGKRRDA